MTPSPLVLAATPPFRTPVPVSHGHRRIGRTTLRVREWPLHYENEGSVQLSSGSVSLGAGAWWSISLSVPGDAGTADDALFVRLERHGARPAGYRGSVEADLTLPRSEIDAIVMLLAGVVDQARRDGVLPARTS